MEVNKDFTHFELYRHAVREKKDKGEVLLNSHLFWFQDDRVMGLSKVWLPIQTR